MATAMAAMVETGTCCGLLRASVVNTKSEVARAVRSRPVSSRANTRRQRAPGGLPRAERDGAVALLERHCAVDYFLLPVKTPVFDRAVALTQRDRRRGYDAVQLATALAVKEYARTAFGMSTQAATDFARNLHATVNSFSGMRS